MMIFFLKDGSASHSELIEKFLWYVEYIYGVNDLNSAAQVSTFLNTGSILRAILLRLIISSEVFVSSDNFLSENPIDFIRLNSLKSLGNPLFLILVSLSTISFICSKNQGSIFDKENILFKSIFFLIASATNKILFGMFSLSFFSI